MTTLSKTDLREMLWDVTCLGSELSSVDDDRLDDLELALNSLTLVWLVIQFERRTGCELPTEPAPSVWSRTVNAMHSYLTGLRSHA